MPKSMKRATVLVLALLISSVAAGKGDASGSSVRVLINEVDVTGLVSQKFEGCTVEFDKDGNVHVTAPGYSIKKVEPSDTPGDTPKAALPTQKHYYLWTENQNGKSVGDKYSVIVNGKVVKEFESSGKQIVEDITEFLKVGTNQIVLTAVKKDSYSGGSSSDYFKIVIGEGQEENSKAVIEKTLHNFTRKASEKDPGQSAYTLKAK